MGINIQLNFDTDALSEEQKKALAVLIGGTPVPVVKAEGRNPVPEPDEEVEEAPKPRARRKPVAKKEPEPEPVEDEDEDEDEDEGSPLDAAVEAATRLVKSGKAAKVKKALAEFDCTRVSELKASQVDEFLELLEA